MNDLDELRSPVFWLELVVCLAGFVAFMALLYAIGS